MAMTATERSSHWIIASGQPLAVAAARDVLSWGGSAIDAAIAADAVLGVTEPMATGLGGDLLAMIVEPDGNAHAFNGTGRSAARLNLDAIATLPDRRIPERHPLAITVPGVVDGWAQLHARYGRIAWSRLFERAIAAATDGFSVAPVTAREWAIFSRVIERDADAAASLHATSPPLAGQCFVNPDLAFSLREIANSGAEAFYQGRIAERIETKLRVLGAQLSRDDLASHRGEFVPPVSTKFRDLDVLECPPNTHGLGVLQALKALEPLPLDEHDPQTHLSMVLAMRDALEYAKQVVTDPAGNTVCTVVVDSDGLAVTLMSSVFKRFGSGIGVPGGGFVLQNRGFGFAPIGAINGVAPGRRPYHTVIPAAALLQGRFHSAFGVVGGAMQPQGHVQLLCRIRAWGATPQAAIDAPRWRLESHDRLAIEHGFPDQIAQTLRAAGFADTAGIGEINGRSDFGGAQWVMRDPSGDLIAGSDRRKDGGTCGN